MLEVMLLLIECQVLTDSRGWWKLFPMVENVHSVTQSDRSYPLAPGATVEVIIHKAGEEVHLPAGSAGDELGHSNNRAGKDVDFPVVVEADNALFVPLHAELEHLCGPVIDHPAAQVNGVGVPGRNLCCHEHIVEGGDHVHVGEGKHCHYLSAQHGNGYK